MKYLPIYLLIFACLFACQNEPPAADYSHIPSAFKVEIVEPAGFSNTQSFLPNIGNIAYLEETKNTIVLVLAEQLAMGKSIFVQPIGTLQIEENKQLKNIIIANPLDSTLQLTQTTNFETFITANAGEKQIIQDWFLYEKGLGVRDLVGWKDEQFALELVKAVGSRQ